MVSNDLMEELDAYLDQHWDQMLEDLADLVSVESVEDLDHAAEGAPYGPGPAEALRRGLALCDRMGFQTRNLEGYVGTADVPGADARQLGAIGHLDVVPLGEGWHFDPLSVTRKGGYLIGRGVSDDKGPLLMALYAAKFWKDRGAELPHTLRFILGANEETGMRDVEHFLQECEPPELVFTPDDEFPVCYGEKGQLQGAFTSKPLKGAIASFEGGIAMNAVPGRARAEVAVPAEKLPQPPQGITVEASPVGATIHAQGVQAHASTPETGTSAIHMIVGYLLQAGVCQGDELAWLQLLDCALGSWDGSGLGVAAQDDAFGPLTLVGGVISTDGDGRMRQTIDIRYPSSVDVDALQGSLRNAAAQVGATWEASRVEPVFLMDRESPFIQALAQSYADVSGDGQPPFTIGGGTYARHFPCAAGFGAGVYGQGLPDWVGGMHAADEGIAEATLQQAFKVYAVAIPRLMDAMDALGKPASE